MRGLYIVGAEKVEDMAMVVPLTVVESVPEGMGGCVRAC